jgi:2,2-dialkylglycine decarboxylase (pyruvate)
MDDPRQRYLIRYAGGFAPVKVVRADGAWLETADGQRILDFTSGQICSTIGHNHPRIAEAIRRSLDEVVHLNSWMLSEPVLALAERLVGLFPEPLDRVMLLNTGSEANEVALKLAKLHTGRFEVVGLTRSFHGLVGGVGSLTFSMGHTGYGPMLPGAFAVPAPYAYRCPVRHCQGACDCTCLEVGFSLVDQQSVGSLAAVVAEPVLSAGGVIVPPDGYFQRLRELCAQRGMLLIVDEAQTGFGRLGTLFGFEHDGIVPDLVAVSKTLGGGIPLAATITSAAIEADCHAKGFVHVTSHVADPLPAAAGLAVLQVIAEEDLVERARVHGGYLLDRLHELAARHEQIGEVRGRGLLVGLELVEDRHSRTPANQLGAAVTAECLRRGLSMNIVRSGANANCFRMAPPLTITRAEIDTAVEILDASIQDALDAAASGRAGAQAGDNGSTGPATDAVSRAARQPGPTTNSGVAASRTRSAAVLPSRKRENPPRP